MDNRLYVPQFALAVANLSVSGAVVDVNDKAVPNARVYCSGQGQPNRRTQTDVEGKFTSVRGYSFLAMCRRSQRRWWASACLSSSYRRVRRDRGVFFFDVSSALSACSAVKQFLVCFWDMQQRPSRHLISQLAEQAEQLKQKEVTVVAVQASKIEKNVLTGWARKYNIVFPMGMIEGDAEKIQFAWGVRALPWLILTDAEHIVRVEGFGLDELSQKIAAVVEKED